MKKLLLAFAALALASPASAVLVITANETTIGSGNYTVNVALTGGASAPTFNVLEVIVNQGNKQFNVANADSSVLPDPFFPFAVNQLIDTDNQQLTVVATSLPGVLGDIDLTMGMVLQPGSVFNGGFAATNFLNFDLLSGLATISVNLLGGTAAGQSQTITIGNVPAIPEPSMVLVFGGLMGSILMARRNR